MAYRTSVHHYDLTARNLLSGPDSALRRIAPKGSEEPTLNIPFWQRDYDWGKEQIENFLSSVHRAAQSQTDLYLGTVVFGIHSKYPDKILVIDGQQRLRSIQNLLIRSLKFFGNGDPAAVLPLVHGLGDAERPIQSDEAVEESLSVKDQKDAFLSANLQKKGFADVSPEKWLPHLKFRVVLTRYEFEGNEGDRDPFDVVMSNLFANVNRQAKPLDDIDVAKAKILFGLRRFGCEKEADAFAREWETARMLQLVPTQLADRALLDVDVLDDETEKILTAVPYDPETVRVQFSRYLLLVKAFAEGADAPANKEYQEIAYKGAFGDEFEKLRRGDDGDALLAFAGALKTVNDLFLANRDFLLLARRNRVEVKEGEEAEKRPLLTPARNRLLMFQGYVNGGTTRASWLSEKTLMRLLRELARCRQVDDAALDEILVRLEKELFKDLMSSSGERPILTARDWFLWRALFDVEGNPVYKVAVKGCEKIIETSAASFTVDSGEALLKRLRENAKSYKPDGLPTATGAAQVEHWAAIERGREKEKEMIDLFESLSNKAHIAEGLNQSMRNDSILKKAGHRDPSWWPTLQFLAAYSACGRGWAVAENSLDQTNLEAFIKPLDEFWKTVSATYKAEDVMLRESDAEA